MLWHFLTVFILFFLHPNLWAQFRDPVSLSSTQYVDSDNQVNEVSLGAPPLKIYDSLILPSLSYRNFILENDLSQISRDKFFLSSLSFNTFIRNQITELTNLSVAVNLNTRQENSKDFFSKNSQFITGLILLNQKLEGPDESFLTYGIVVLDQQSRLPFVPAIGYSSTSADKVHSYNIGLPRTFYTYKVSDFFQTGVAATFDQTTFALEQSEVNSYKYLALQRLSIEGLARFQLITNSLFMTTRFGYSTFNQDFILETKKSERIGVVPESRSLYFLNATLSLQF